MFKESVIKNRDVIQLAANLKEIMPFLIVEYETGKGYVIAYDFDSQPTLIWPIGESAVPARVAMAFLNGMKEALDFVFAGEVANVPKVAEGV